MPAGGTFLLRPPLAEVGAEISCRIPRGEGCKGQSKAPAPLLRPPTLHLHPLTRMVKTLGPPVRNFGARAQLHIHSEMVISSAKGRPKEATQVPSVSCGCALFLHNGLANFAQGVRLTLSDALCLAGLQDTARTLNVRRLA